MTGHQELSFLFTTIRVSPEKTESGCFSSFFGQYFFLGMSLRVEKKKEKLKKKGERTFPFSVRRKKGLAA